MYFRRSWPSRFGACTFVRAEKRGGSEDNGGKIVPEIGRDFADQRQLLDPEFAHTGVERPLPLRLFHGIERRLVVAQRSKEVPLVYCPVGPLFRQELELTSEHFDTLHLVGLLPGKAVSDGETWKLSNPVVQALCNFEGLAEQDLLIGLGPAVRVQFDEEPVRLLSNMDSGAQPKSKAVHARRLAPLQAAIFDLAPCSWHPAKNPGKAATSLGAHASSVPCVSDAQHAGCLSSRERGEKSLPGCEGLSAYSYR